MDESFYRGRRKKWWKQVAEAFFPKFCQEWSHFLCYIFPLLLLSWRKYSNFRRVFHQVSRLIGNCLQLTAFIPPGYSVFIGPQLINISRLPSKWLSPCNFGPNLKLSILFSDNFWHFTNQTFGQSYNFRLTEAWTRYWGRKEGITPHTWEPGTWLRGFKQTTVTADCRGLSLSVSPPKSSKCTFERKKK